MTRAATVKPSGVVWPFSFDFGSWHHDKHAFSVQGKISPDVPTRRAWLHPTEVCVTLLMMV